MKWLRIRNFREIDDLAFEHKFFKVTLSYIKLI
ncbi:hypothetical protein Zm00014a_001355 [Zea mays]|uniref:Uncharacterized protein n=1 Tax=Zea mays TaxID=4577 RepID=A0A3L6E7C7_MAIZE|nr:hypothetical protein Zm00014a_001355 [Zea mays]